MPTRRDDRHVAPGRPPGPPKAAPAFTAVRPYGTADPLPAELPPEPVIDPYAGAARVPPPVPTPAAVPAPPATPTPAAVPTPAAMPPPAAMPMPAAVPTPIAVPYPVSTPVPVPYPAPPPPDLEISTLRTAVVPPSADAVVPTPVPAGDATTSPPPPVAPSPPRARPRPVLPRYEPAEEADGPARRPISRATRRQAPARQPLPGSVRKALFEEFPAEKSDAKASSLPLWAAFCRGVAAWLGVLAAATALAVPADVAFPIELWWLDASMLPPEGTRFGLAAWGVTLILSALLPSLPGMLRFAGSFGAAVVVGLSLRSTALFFATARDGLFHTHPTLPLEFFVAVLAFVAVAALRHPGGRPTWPGVVATSVAFVVALAGFAVTHVATAARLDDRGPADVLVVLPSADEQIALAVDKEVAAVVAERFVPSSAITRIDDGSDLGRVLASAEAITAGYDSELFGSKRPTVLLVGADAAMADARLHAARAGYRSRGVPITGSPFERAASWTEAAKQIWTAYLPTPAFVR